MIKQLFFIFKLSSEQQVSDAKMLEKIKSILSAVNCDGEGLTKHTYDAQTQFYYCFYHLASPLSSQQVQSLKQMLLDGKLDCDILMSEDFPCFNEAYPQKGALVMDMDMTTVQIEGIDEIARRLGVFDEVAAITHEAMHGKLDFSQSLRKRVSLLKGGDAQIILDDVRSHMPETSGLSTLMAYCDTIRSRIAPGEFYTCIASGGFHNLISAIDEKYHLSMIRANRLAVDSDGKFTGEVDGPIIDGQAKADLVKELKASGVPVERIIVVGDGANDLLMMQEGGLGIAYHAKPKVQQQQLNALNIGDLSSIATLLIMRSAL